MPGYTLVPDARLTDIVAEIGAALTFLIARAWVGEMLSLRRDDFDDLILQRKAPKARFHWGKKTAMAPCSAHSRR